ncbi:hypothetical protein CEXT_459201 [Caerostris extrusa]|uniref:Uncharacterized protein n=1 Tax=Caerostris extrusa TaxID=172846 RepID=A0AAV4QCG6_CAEEX|nr:hypothetical protein CEXT_459201 [Caerostris extrusa]
MVNPIRVEEPMKRDHLFNGVENVKWLVSIVKIGHLYAWLDETLSEWHVPMRRRGLKKGFTHASSSLSLGATGDRGR